MDGSELRAIREARGDGQQEFATWLNGALGRRYDRARISRWESGAERIPQQVVSFLRGGGQPIPPHRTAGTGKATVLVIANQKGGVGKTASAVNLAYALSMAGRRVLLVDSDPQANATVHLGQNPFALEEAGTTLYHVLRRDRPVASIVVPVCDGRFDLAPSSITLAAADTELISEPGGSLVLREKLADLKDSYDYILIDSPPHLGLLTINALSAADLVLIPVQTEVLSAMGIPLLLDTVDKIRRRSNPSLRVFGLLPTMYSPRQTQDRATLAELQAQYAGKTRIFTPITRSTLYAQSVAAGRATLEALPDTPGVHGYVELAHELIRHAELQEMTIHGAA